MINPPKNHVNMMDEMILAATSRILGLIPLSRSQITPFEYHNDIQVFNQI